MGKVHEAARHGAIHLSWNVKRLVFHAYFYDYFCILLHESFEKCDLLFIFYLPLDLLPNKEAYAGWVFCHRGSFYSRLFLCQNSAEE